MNLGTQSEGIKEMTFNIRLHEGGREGGKKKLGRRCYLKLQKRRSFEKIKEVRPA